MEHQSSPQESLRCRPHSAPTSWPRHPAATLLAGAGLPALSSGDGEEEGRSPAAALRGFPMLRAGATQGALSQGFKALNEAPEEDE
jgi:hypothetical protein